MAATLLDSQGRIVWTDRTHPAVASVEDVLGTRAWEWNAPAARDRGRLLFADALLYGASGPVEIPVELGGQRREHRVAYRAVPTAAVVCVWYEGADVRLSPREHEVLLLLCAELTPTQVARRLGITKSTVDTYRASLRQKLGVASIAGKVRWAIRAGLIDA